MRRGLKILICFVGRIVVIRPSNIKRMPNAQTRSYVIGHTTCISRCMSQHYDDKYRLTKSPHTDQDANRQQDSKYCPEARGDALLLGVYRYHRSSLPLPSFGLERQGRVKKWRDRICKSFDFDFVMYWVIGQTSRANIGQKRPGNLHLH